MVSGDWWWGVGRLQARLTLSLKIAAWSALDSRAGQPGQGQARPGLSREITCTVGLSG